MFSFRIIFEFSSKKDLIDPSQALTCLRNLSCLIYPNPDQGRNSQKNPVSFNFWMRLILLMSVIPFDKTATRIITWK